MSSALLNVASILKLLDSIVPEIIIISVEVEILAWYIVLRAFIFDTFHIGPN